MGHLRLRENGQQGPRSSGYTNSVPATAPPFSGRALRGRRSAWMDANNATSRMSGQRESPSAKEGWFSLISCPSPAEMQPPMTGLVPAARCFVSKTNRQQFHVLLLHGTDPTRLRPARPRPRRKAGPRAASRSSRRRARLRSRRSGSRSTSRPGMRRPRSPPARAAGATGPRRRRH